MGRGVRAAVIGGVFTAMVGGAAYGAHTIMSALDGGTGTGEAASVTSGPPSADEVRETAERFFAAWEKGDAVTAAGHTDNAEAAEALLTAYAEDARISGLTVTPGEVSVSGAAVPFTVRATVSHEGVSKPLSYEGKLTVVRGETSGRPLVDWRPSVVHPELEAGDTLVTEESTTPPVRTLGRDGTVLTARTYPSLGPVLETLRERYGERAGGTPGVELVIRHEGAVPDTPLLTLADGKPGELRTTISATAQAAAEAAVKRHGESSVVAVKPSTGEVLAVANNRADGFNAAFEGAAAPGSTMKIVTAAMLIDNGVTSMNARLPKRSRIRMKIAKNFYRQMPGCSLCCRHERDLPLR